MLIEIEYVKNRYINIMLEITPIQDTVIPYAFNPSKLYEKPKFAFSSAINGNFVESLVLEINHVTAVET